MSDVTIYHNPRCSKSRGALEILREKGVDAQVVQYLQAPPSAEELRAVLSKLQMRPEQIVRRGEAVYKEKFAGRSLTDDEWVAALVENPVLIERPIVIRGDRAVVGRPPEKVLDLL